MEPLLSRKKVEPQCHTEVHPIRESATDRTKDVSVSLAAEKVEQFVKNGRTFGALTQLGAESGNTGSAGGL